MVAVNNVFCRKGMIRQQLPGAVDTDMWYIYNFFLYLKKC